MSAHELSVTDFIRTQNIIPYNPCLHDIVAATRLFCGAVGGCIKFFYGVQKCKAQEGTLARIKIMLIQKPIEANTTNLKPGRSTRWGWYLFDFANSILVINGSLYFPQWIVGQENKVGDVWFNMVFVISSIFLLVLGPTIGFIVDRSGNRLKLLTITSLGLVISGAIVGLSPAIVDQDSRVFVALVAFFFVLVFYQLSLVFYNSMLNAVAGGDNDTKYSGRALAWGWIGGIVAIFFGLVFTKGMLPSVGSAGMASILPSAILTGILVLVSLLMMRHADDRVGIVSPAEQKPQLTVKEALRRLFLNRATLVFLIAYLLYSDAILTLQNNSTIFMDQVHRFSDDSKAYLFILVLFTGAIGAVCVTPLVRTKGLVNTLRIVLFGWIAVTIASGITNNSTTFIVLFAVMGLLNGAVWNVSRVLYHRLVPDSIRNASFGVYSTFERFASILGPIAWSSFLYLGAGTERYQIAWGAMSVFIVFSLLALALYRNGGGNRDGTHSH